MARRLTKLLYATSSQKKKLLKKEDKMLDINSNNVIGFLTIRDKHTKEVLVDKNNAIHFGNFSNAMARALAGNDAGHIKYMAFGNGGTQIDSTGIINYKAPNVSSVVDASAGLYNETYRKDVSSLTDPNNKITVVSTGSANYTDISILATLTFSEPATQDATDGEGNIEGDFVFDEIALYDSGDSNELMLTHVMFHPVKKSANREIEIEYTLRIQVS